MTSTTMITGTSRQTSVINFDFDVEVAVESPCNFILQVNGVRMEGAESAAQEQELARLLALHPVHFGFEGGRVREVCTESGEPVWATNIKRGILSSFQQSFQQPKNRQKVLETDVVGKCETEYKLINTFSDRLRMRKVKDMSSCSDNQVLYQYALNIPHLNIQHLPILRSSHECEVAIKGRRLDQVDCHEVHLFKPFSQDGSGAQTVVDSTLSLTGVEEAIHFKQLVDPVPHDSLLFVHQHKRADDTADRQHARNLLHAYLSLQDNQIPTLFNKLVYALRSLEYDDLKRLYATVNSKKERKFFYDALPLLKTDGSVKLMCDIIENKHVGKDKVLSWLSTLAAYKNPTAIMIGRLADLMDNLENYEGMLGISALVHTYCLGNNNCKDVDEVKAIVKKTNSLLGSSCESSSDEEEQKLLVTLKSMANYGFSYDSGKKIEQCYLSHSNSEWIRTAALETLGRFQCDSISSRLASLLNLFGDIQQDSELRINAYLSIMKCPSAALVEQVKKILFHEQINQVGSFVWTHLTNLQETQTKNPFRRELRLLLGTDVLQNKWKSDVRKFSRNMEMSYYSNEWKMGGTLDTNIIFSEKSYLPRSGMLNLTTNIFGENVNLIQVAARIEGMEDVVENLFGPDGYLREENIHKFVSGLRPKRDTTDSNELEEKFKYEKKKPRLDLNFNIFDNNVYYKSFHEVTSLLESMIDNPLDFVGDFISGKEVEFKQSSMFLDGCIILPTVAGLPLNLTVNGTSFVTLDSKVSVDFGDLITKGNAQVKLEVHPAASVEISGLMVVDAFVAKAGIKSVIKMHTSSYIDNLLVISQGKLAKFQINLPNDKVDIIDLKSDFFLVHNNDLLTLDSEFQKSSHEICSPDFLGETLGIKACASTNHYHDEGFSSPLWFYSGPSRLQASISKVDTFDVAIFECSFIQDNNPSRGIITKMDASYDTPGSTRDRKSFFHLSFDESQSHLLFELSIPTVGFYINIGYEKAAYKSLVKLELAYKGLNIVNLSYNFQTSEKKYECEAILSYLQKEFIKFRGVAHVKDSKLSWDSYLYILRERIKFIGDYAIHDDIVDISSTFDSTKLVVNYAGKLFLKYNDWKSLGNIVYEMPGSGPQHISISTRSKTQNAGVLWTRFLELDLKPINSPEWNTAISWEYQVSPGYRQNRLGLTFNGRTWALHQKLNAQANEVSQELTVQCSINDGDLIDFDIDFQHKIDFGLVTNITNSLLLKLSTNYWIEGKMSFAEGGDPYIFLLSGEINFPSQSYMASIYIAEPFSGAKEYNGQLQVILGKAQNMSVLFSIGEGNQYQHDYHFTSRLKINDMKPIETSGRLVTNSREKYRMEVHLNTSSQYYNADLEFDPEFEDGMQGTFLINEAVYSGKLTINKTDSVKSAELIFFAPTRNLTIVGHLRNDLTKLSVEMFNNIRGKRGMIGLIDVQIDETCLYSEIRYYSHQSQLMINRSNSTVFFRIDWNGQVVEFKCVYILNLNEINWLLALKTPLKELEDVRIHFNIFSHTISIEGLEIGVKMELKLNEPRHLFYFNTAFDSRIRSNLQLISTFPPFDDISIYILVDPLSQNSEVVLEADIHENYLNFCFKKKMIQYYQGLTKIQGSVYLNASSEYLQNLDINYSLNMSETIFQLHSNGNINQFSLELNGNGTMSSSEMNVTWILISDLPMAPSIRGDHHLKHTDLDGKLDTIISSESIQIQLNVSWVSRIHPQLDILLDAIYKQKTFNMLFNFHDFADSRVLSANFLFDNIELAFVEYEHKVQEDYGTLLSFEAKFLTKSMSILMRYDEHNFSSHFIIKRGSYFILDFRISKSYEFSGGEERYQYRFLLSIPSMDFTKSLIAKFKTDKDNYMAKLYWKCQDKQLKAIFTLQQSSDGLLTMMKSDSNIEFIEELGLMFEMKAVDQNSVNVSVRFNLNGKEFDTIIEKNNDSAHGFDIQLHSTGLFGTFNATVRVKNNATSSILKMAFLGENEYRNILNFHFQMKDNSFLINGLMDIYMLPTCKFSVDIKDITMAIAVFEITDQDQVLMAITGRVAQGNGLITLSFNTLFSSKLLLPRINIYLNSSAAVFTEPGRKFVSLLIQIEESDYLEAMLEMDLSRNKLRAKCKISSQMKKLEHITALFNAEWNNVYKFVFTLNTIEEFLSIDINTSSKHTSKKYSFIMISSWLSRNISALLLIDESETKFVYNDDYNHFDGTFFIKPNQYSVKLILDLPSYNFENVTMNATVEISDGVYIHAHGIGKNMHLSVASEIKTSSGFAKADMSIPQLDLHDKYSEIKFTITHGKVSIFMNFSGEIINLTFVHDGTTYNIYCNSTLPGLRTVDVLFETKNEDNVAVYKLTVTVNGRLNVINVKKSESVMKYFHLDCQSPSLPVKRIVLTYNISRYNVDMKLDVSSLSKIDLRIKDKKGLLDTPFEIPSIQQVVKFIHEADILVSIEILDGTSIHFKSIKEDYHLRFELGTVCFNMIIKETFHYESYLKNADTCILKIIYQKEENSIQFLYQSDFGRINRLACHWNSNVGPNKFTSGLEFNDFFINSETHYVLNEISLQSKSIINSNVESWEEFTLHLQYSIQTTIQGRIDIERKIGNVSLEADINLKNILPTISIKTSIPNYEEIILYGELRNSQLEKYIYFTVRNKSSILGTFNASLEYSRSFNFFLLHGELNSIFIRDVHLNFQYVAEKGFEIEVATECEKEENVYYLIVSYSWVSYILHVEFSLPWIDGSFHGPLSNKIFRNTILDIPTRRKREAHGNNNQNYVAPDLHVSKFKLFKVVYFKIEYSSDMQIFSLDFENQDELKDLKFSFEYNLANIFENGSLKARLYHPKTNIDHFGWISYNIINRSLSNGFDAEFMFQHGNIPLMQGKISRIPGRLQIGITTPLVGWENIEITVKSDWHSFIKTFLKINNLEYSVKFHQVGVNDFEAEIETPINGYEYLFASYNLMNDVHKITFNKSDDVHLNAEMTGNLNIKALKIAELKMNAYFKNKTFNLEFTLGKVLKTLQIKTPYKMLKHVELKLANEIIGDALMTEIVVRYNEEYLNHKSKTLWGTGHVHNKSILLTNATFVQFEKSESETWIYYGTAYDDPYKIRSTLIQDDVLIYNMSSSLMIKITNGNLDMKFIGVFPSNHGKVHGKILLKTDFSVDAEIDGKIGAYTFTMKVKQEKMKFNLLLVTNIDWLKNLEANAIWKISHGQSGTFGVDMNFAKNHEQLFGLKFEFDIKPFNKLTGNFIVPSMFNETVSLSFENSTKNQFDISGKYDGLASVDVKGHLDLSKNLADLQIFNRLSDRFWHIKLMSLLRQENPVDYEADMLLSTPFTPLLQVKTYVNFIDPNRRLDLKINFGEFSFDLYSNITWNNDDLVLDIRLKSSSDGFPDLNVKAVKQSDSYMKGELKYNNSSIILELNNIKSFNRKEVSLSLHLPMRDYPTLTIGMELNELDNGDVNGRFSFDFANYFITSSLNKSETNLTWETRSSIPLIKSIFLYLSSDFSSYYQLQLTWNDNSMNSSLHLLNYLYNLHFISTFNNFTELKASLDLHQQNECIITVFFVNFLGTVEGNMIVQNELEQKDMIDIVGNFSILQQMFQLSANLKNENSHKHCIIDLTMNEHEKFSLKYDIESMSNSIQMEVLLETPLDFSRLIFFHIYVEHASDSNTGKFTFNYNDKILSLIIGSKGGHVYFDAKIPIDSYESIKMDLNHQNGNIKTFVSIGNIKIDAKFVRKVTIYNFVIIIQTKLSKLEFVGKIDVIGRALQTSIEWNDNKASMKANIGGRKVLISLRSTIANFPSIIFTGKWSSTGNGFIVNATGTINDRDYTFVSQFNRTRNETYGYWESSTGMETIRFEVHVIREVNDMKVNISLMLPQLGTFSCAVEYCVDEYLFGGKISIQTPLNRILPTLAIDVYSGFMRGRVLVLYLKAAMSQRYVLVNGSLAIPNNDFVHLMLLIDAPCFNQEIALDLKSSTVSLYDFEHTLSMRMNEQTISGTLKLFWEDMKKIAKADLVYKDLELHMSVDSEIVNFQHFGKLDLNGMHIDMIYNILDSSVKLTVLKNAENADGFKLSVDFQRYKYLKFSYNSSDYDIVFKVTLSHVYLQCLFFIKDIEGNIISISFDNSEKGGVEILIKEAYTGEEKEAADGMVRNKRSASMPSLTTSRRLKRSSRHSSRDLTSYHHIICLANKDKTVLSFLGPNLVLNITSNDVIYQSKLVFNKEHEVEVSIRKNETSLDIYICLVSSFLNDEVMTSLVFSKERGCTLFNTAFKYIFHHEISLKILSNQSMHNFSFSLNSQQFEWLTCSFNGSLIFRNDNHYVGSIDIISPTGLTLLEYDCEFPNLQEFSGKIRFQHDHKLQSDTKVVFSFKDNNLHMYVTSNNETFDGISLQVRIYDEDPFKIIQFYATLPGNEHYRLKISADANMRLVVPSDSNLIITYASPKNRMCAALSWQVNETSAAAKVLIEDSGAITYYLILSSSWDQDPHINLEAHLPLIGTLNFSSAFFYDQSHEEYVAHFNIDLNKHFMSVKVTIEWLKQTIIGEMKSSLKNFENVVIQLGLKYDNLHKLLKLHYMINDHSRGIKIEYKFHDFKDFCVEFRVNFASKDWTDIAVALENVMVKGKIKSRFNARLGKHEALMEFRKATFDLFLQANITFLDFQLSLNKEYQGDQQTRSSFNLEAKIFDMNICVTGFYKMSSFGSDICVEVMVEDRRIILLEKNSKSQTINLIVKNFPNHIDLNAGIQYNMRECGSHHSENFLMFKMHLQVFVQKSIFFEKTVNFESGNYFKTVKIAIIKGGMLSSLEVKLDVSEKLHFLLDANINSKHLRFIVDKRQRLYGSDISLKIDSEYFPIDILISTNEQCHDVSNNANITYISEQGKKVLLLKHNSVTLDGIQTDSIIFKRVNAEIEEMVILQSSNTQGKNEVTLKLDTNGKEISYIKMAWHQGEDEDKTFISGSFYLKNIEDYRKKINLRLTKSKSLDKLKMELETLINHWIIQANSQKTGHVLVNDLTGMLNNKKVLSVRQEVNFLKLFTWSTVEYPYEDKTTITTSLGMESKKDAVFKVMGTHHGLTTDYVDARAALQDGHSFVCTVFWSEFLKQDIDDKITESIIRINETVYDDFFDNLLFTLSSFEDALANVVVDGLELTQQFRAERFKADFEEFLNFVHSKSTHWMLKETVEYYTSAISSLLNKWISLVGEIQRGIRELQMVLIHCLRKDFGLAKTSITKLRTLLDSTKSNLIHGLQIIQYRLHNPSEDLNDYIRLVVKIYKSLYEKAMDVYKHYVKDWRQLFADFLQTVLMDVKNFGRNLLAYLRSVEILADIEAYLLKQSRIFEDVKRFFQTVSEKYTSASTRFKEWYQLIRSYLTEMFENISKYEEVKALIVMIKSVHSEIPKLKMTLSNYKDLIFNNLLSKLDVSTATIVRILDIIITGKQFWGFETEFNVTQGICRLEVTLPFQWNAFDDIHHLVEVSYSDTLSIPDVTKFYLDMNDLVNTLTEIDMTENVLPPYDANAFVLGNKYIMTFDKKVYKFKGDGVYLLCQEFFQSSFSVYSHYLNGDLQFIIIHYGGQVFKLSTRGEFYVEDELIDLPYANGDANVKLDGRKIYMDLGFTLSLSFNKANKIFAFHIPGKHFGKTGGLLGIYDYEPNNDWMTSDRVITNELETFVNSWCVGNTCSHVNQTFLENNYTQWDLRKCYNLFEAENSFLLPCFGTVPPSIYYKLCLAELASLPSQPDLQSGHCFVINSYLEECKKHNVIMYPPTECITCHVPWRGAKRGGEHFSYRGSSPNSTDVVLVLEQNACLASFDFSMLVSKLEHTLAQRGITGNQYSLVMYGGSGPFHLPHTQSVQNNIFVDAKAVLNGLNRIVFNSSASGDAYEALRFAVSLNFRPGVSKTLILLNCHNVKEGRYYGDASVMLDDYDATLHYIAPYALELKNKRMKSIYGYDKKTVFSYLDQSRSLNVGASLRPHLKVPKDYMSALAVESDGSVFSQTFFSKDSREVAQANFEFVQRLAKTALPSNCQVCDCTPDKDGGGKVMCQKCFIPNVDVMLRKWSEYTNLNGY